jgi:hypothetical protein
MVDGSAISVREVAVAISDKSSTPQQFRAQAQASPTFSINTDIPLWLTFNFGTGNSGS